LRAVLARNVEVAVAIVAGFGVPGSGFRVLFGVRGSGFRVRGSMSFDVTAKRVTVAGAARSGIAAAELLARRGARVTLSEARAEVPSLEKLESLGVQLELGGHRTETFSSADLIVLSPGVPVEQPAIAAARACGVPVIAEIELASRWLQGRLIAITGTK